MKIIVAQSTAAALPGGDYFRKTLTFALEAEGHKVQHLDLPSIAAPGRALTNVASLRLMGTELTAVTLICLDPVSAILRHSRKIIVLLDDSYLAPDRVQLPRERASERRYIGNVLQNALGEADQIFTLSRFASEGLRALSIDRTLSLEPEIEMPLRVHERHQGPELLAIGRLDERQRPELLIACLASLPEPLRARWIAPEATPTRVANLLKLARDAGVEQRLAIDVRRVNDGEKAYLLAHAAALLELAPGTLAMGETVRQATDIGVPVITCVDGGASVEMLRAGSPAPAEANPTAIAAAICAALGAYPAKPDRKLARRQPPSVGWAPLFKAIVR